jgi:hypothetical protein
MHVLKTKAKSFVFFVDYRQIWEYRTKNNMNFGTIFVLRQLHASPAMILYVHTLLKNCVFYVKHQRRVIQKVEDGVKEAEAHHGHHPTILAL